MTVNYKWLIAGAALAAALLTIWAVLAVVLLTAWTGLSRSPEPARRPAAPGAAGPAIDHGGRFPATSQPANRVPIPAQLLPYPEPYPMPWPAPPVR